MVGPTTIVVAPADVAVAFAAVAILVVAVVSAVFAPVVVPSTADAASLVVVTRAVARESFHATASNDASESSHKD